MHESTRQVLQHFEYDHLPTDRAAVSKRFYDLAHEIAEDPYMQGPEVTAGLRKLLEAKDCIVRAFIESERNNPHALNRTS